MQSDFDLETPAGRKSALRAIAQGDAVHHHELLRRIFAAEVEFRRKLAYDDLGDDWDSTWGEDDDYFENVYWCAWLLSLVGDPSDVPSMWHAKYEVEFDLQCGFDIENMLGAGPCANARLAARAWHARDCRPSGALVRWGPCRGAGTLVSRPSSLFPRHLSGRPMAPGSGFAMQQAR